MLAYLIAISILNILLGYALAVYLMRASQSAEFAQRSMEASKRDSHSPDSSAAFVSTSTSTSTPGGSVFSREPSRDVNNVQPVQAAVTATPTEATAADASRQSSEETDAQLLAGIADFRSQLAKLRSSTTMEPGSPGLAASER